MSQLKQQYVAAAAEMLAERQDAALIVKRLREVMARHGHQRLFPGVLKALESALERQAAMAAPRLTLAKAEDARLYADAAKGAAIEVDGTIIGGYILRRGHQRVDRSYKTRLLNWYRAAIND